MTDRVGQGAAGTGGHSDRRRDLAKPGPRRRRYALAAAGLWLPAWSAMAQLPLSPVSVADPAVNSAASAKTVTEGLVLDYIRRGEAAGYQGRSDEAIADFTQAIALQPDEQGFQERGVAYLQKSRFDQAIADFSHAIALKPGFFEAYQSRGVAYDQKGLYDKAIDDYTCAISMKPDVAEVYFNRGAAYEHRRLYQMAAKDYRASLKLNPNLQSSKDGLKRIGAKN